MTETVRITKVYINDKDKEDKPFTTKKGKPFWKVAIKTDKYPNDWLSALAFEQDDAEMQLQEGDEVKIIVETNGQYKNFKMPTRLDQLEERVVILEVFMQSSVANKVMAKPSADEPPIRDEDIPF